jgi:hypothetical protein
MLLQLFLKIVVTFVGKMLLQHFLKNVDKQMLAIPEHFEPGPTRPAHEPYWTGMGRDLEAREIFFWPEPGPKIEARCVQWDGHGQDFFGLQ